MEIYIYILYIFFLGGGLEVGSLIVGRVCFHPRHEGGPGVSKTTVVSHRFFLPTSCQKIHEINVETLQMFMEMGGFSPTLMVSQFSRSLF